MTLRSYKSNVNLFLWLIGIHTYIHTYIHIQTHSFEKEPHLGESYVREGHILEDDLEFGRALNQLLGDLLADDLALGQQLGGIVLGHHSLGHLVH